MAILTNNDSNYLTLPAKSLPIYFNVTAIENRAALGAVALGLAGELVRAHTRHNIQTRALKATAS